MLPLRLQQVCLTVSNLYFIKNNDTQHKRTAVPSIDCALNTLSGEINWRYVTLYYTLMSHRSEVTAVRIYYTLPPLPAMDFLSSMTNTRTHEGEEKKKKTEIKSFLDSRSGIDLNKQRHSSPSAHSHSHHFSHRHCTQNTAIDCSEVA